MYIELQGRLIKKEEFEVKCDLHSVYGLIPDGFQFQLTGSRTLWNILQCRIECLRPAGLPEWCGISFDFTSYRLPVKIVTQENTKLKGLFCVHAESSYDPIEHLQKAIPELGISSLSNIPFLSMIDKTAADRDWPLFSLDPSGWVVSTKLILQNSGLIIRTGNKEGKLAPQPSKTFKATSVKANR